ncbi:5191_t:CDS:2, partial [Entrophospora sp. SA101]
YTFENSDGLNKLKFYYNMNAADAEKGKVGLALRVFSPSHHAGLGIMGAILAWLFGSSSLDSWGIARRIAVICSGIWVIILMILDVR